MPAHFLNAEEQDASHDQGISIVKIGPGQHLKLKATARMGIAKEHAKWSPVAVATYRFDPIITINEEACALLTMEQKQQLVDACPDRILELDEVSGKLIFSVEGTGAMDAEDILMSALKVLKDRLNYLATMVENLKDM
jgi:DNA-directed RNA polymerase II subunit RPB3